MGFGNGLQGIGEHESWERGKCPSVYLGKPTIHRHDYCEYGIYKRKVDVQPKHHCIKHAPTFVKHRSLPNYSISLKIANDVIIYQYVHPWLAALKSASSVMPYPHQNRISAYYLAGVSFRTQSPFSGESSSYSEAMSALTETVVNQAPGRRAQLARQPRRESAPVQTSPSKANIHRH
jgi:hypothetical protein